MAVQKPHKEWEKANRHNWRTQKHGSGAKRVIEAIWIGAPIGRLIGVAEPAMGTRDRQPPEPAPAPATVAERLADRHAPEPAPDPLVAMYADVCEFLQRGHVAPPDFDTWRARYLAHPARLREQPATQAG